MTIQIESLTIRAFRGIRREEHFEFNGQNAVIVGPNGSGKSTILQAIEYLLTGEVSALQGAGTRGIQKTEHVPNQYADPEKTAVSARFSTPTRQSFRVVRRFSDSGGLETDDPPAGFKEFTSAAQQGLIHLSRQELLELVIATPGNRKDQIYHLMDTRGIDGRRKQLKRLAKTANEKAETQTTRYEEHLRQLRQVAGDEVVTEFDGETTLRTAALRETVNDLRERLGGDPIEDVDTVETFQQGLTSPLEQASNPLQRQDVRDRLTTIEEWAESGAEEAASTLSELREELRALSADQDALDMLVEKALVQQGLDLMDDSTTKCPLCKEPWDTDSLKNHLENRAERLARIDERIDRIDQLAVDARGDLESIQMTADRIVESLADADLNVDPGPIAGFRDALARVIEALSQDLTSTPVKVDPDRLVLPKAEQAQAARAASKIQDIARQLPDRSLIERSWSQLQTLDDAYHGLSEAAEDRRVQSQVAAELETAHTTFLGARDAVLGEMFETISDQFAEFYELVNPDESAFDPTLSQTNTGVNFAVDFYDTGSHPPHAMHSEGHQDLMGVCLFLALAGELSPLERLPVLLDDVVMSVDEGHREQFAEVLQNELSDHFQLLITTHNQVWARQLVESGVVDESNVIRFTDWSPDRGPTMGSGLG